MTRAVVALMASGALGATGLPGSAQAALPAALAAVPAAAPAQPAVAAVTVDAPPATIVPAATGLVGSVRPERLFDSRTTTAFAPGEERSVCETIASVPDGAAAVVLNLTTVSPKAAGFLTAWPLGTDAPPPVSNLNFSAGAVTSNLAVVPLGTNDCVTVRNSSRGSTHVVVDVESYLTGGPAAVAGATQTVYASRLLDTRTKGVSIPSRGTLDVQVAGTGTIPGTDVGAAWLNFTVTGNAAPGYLTTYPSGTTRPTTSSLNFGAGETRAGLTLATLGTSGRVTVYNGSSKPVHLVVDASAWVRSGDGSSTLAGTLPIAPVRALDTRTTQTPAGGDTVYVSPTIGSPPPRASGVILAVTAVGAATPGYLTVYGTNRGLPATSSVNFVPGRATTNVVVSQLDGVTAIRNWSSQPVDVVVDVVGWLNAERGIAGTVTSTQGEPLSNSPVYGSTGTSPLLAYTAADGRYSAALVPFTASTRACAGSPIRNGLPTYDYATDCYPSWSNPTLITLGLGERATGVDVALEPAGRLRGAATDSSGAKLTSGSVTLYRLGSTRTFRASISNGTWLLPGVPAGSYYLSLFGPVSATSTSFGLANEWYPDVQPSSITTSALLRDSGAEAVDVAAGDTTTVDLVAEPLARLSGTLSNPDGTPVTAQTGLRLRRPNGTIWSDSSSSASSPATWVRFARPGVTTTCAYRRLGEPESCWEGNVPVAGATPITLPPGEDRTGIAIRLP
jgi:hypothetical protein